MFITNPRRIQIQISKSMPSEKGIILRHDIVSNIIMGLILDPSLFQSSG